jgi:uncharacterized membrane protein (DUF485 family)
MSTRTPKFINLKTDPSLFNAKPKQPMNTTLNALTKEVLQSINANNSNTQSTQNKTPWSWWSALMWMLFVLGFALLIAGFFKVLTTKNTENDKTNADKPFKSLAAAMLIIGFVLCFIPFIISIITGIRMF